MDNNDNKNPDISTAYGRWLLRKDRWKQSAKDWRWHVEHRFWWFIHNAVAHPIMGVIPSKKAMQFHDWTGDKLNKVSQVPELSEKAKKLAEQNKINMETIKKFMKENPSDESLERFM